MHNEANGEANRDGMDNNVSWNCGVEGPTEDAAIESLRRRQVKNFIVTLLISLGTPMLLMGDEMRRTQRGNNNAYCQDNEVTWLDWSLLDRHLDLHRFVRTLVSHRLRGIELGAAESFGLSLNELLRRAEIDWHGIRLGQPDWTDDSHSLACTIRSGPGRLPFWVHLMVNAYWEALDFDLPDVPRTAVCGWQRWIDTAREAPEDIVDPPAAPPVARMRYRVMPRSVAALFVRIDTRSGPPLEEDW
jgi:glycogen operon protein